MKLRFGTEALSDEEVSESVNPIGKITVGVLGKLAVSWVRLKVLLSQGGY